MQRTVKTKTTHRPPRPPKSAIRPPAIHSITDFVKVATDRLAEQAVNLVLQRPHNTVAAIKIDHDALRNFISVLKDSDKKMTERRRAYEQFATLLKSHTMAEEKAIYATSIRLTGRPMHTKITEGYVEHLMADDLMKRIERTKNPMQWGAHVNVLAEIVEHHLKEEEDDLLPLIRKEASAKVDQKMLTEYLSLREKSQRQKTKRNHGVLKGRTARPRKAGKATRH